MKYLLAGLSILHLLQVTTGLFTTVECPSYSQTESFTYPDLDVSPLDCTLLVSCTDSLSTSNDPNIESYCPRSKIYSDDSLFDCSPDGSHACAMRLKVNLIRDWNIQSMDHNPCSDLHDPSTPTLLPYPGNCSLFYKCDWGIAVLFECPSELHFNPELQVCDWPWQASCSDSWIGCPRPYPRCPADYPKALYFPHPHRCDRFYQCDWGTPRLQTCPTGLEFDPILKICDWPYKAKCQTC